MKVLAFLTSVIFGMLLWWSLCFIHSVEQFHDKSHDEVASWFVSAPTTEDSSADAGAEEPEVESATE